MVHVWYVEYGDTAHNINPSAIYEQVLAAIRKEDPNAYIEEIRQYQYQIAFLVNHPTMTLAEYQKRRLFPWVVLILAIAAVLVASGYVINAYTGYIRETREYLVRDPETGEEYTIVGYDSYRAWLITHYPEQAQYLADIGATDWFARITSWIPLVFVLIGATIFLPLIINLIPKR